MAFGIRICQLFVVDSSSVSSFPLSVADYLADSNYDRPRSVPAVVTVSATSELQFTGKPRDGTHQSHDTSANMLAFLIILLRCRYLEVMATIRKKSETMLLDVWSWLCSAYLEMPE